MTWVERQGYWSRAVRGLWLGHASNRDKYIYIYVCVCIYTHILYIYILDIYMYMNLFGPMALPAATYSPVSRAALSSETESPASASPAALRMCWRYRMLNSEACVTSSAPRILAANHLQTRSYKPTTPNILHRKP